MRSDDKLQTLHVDVLLVTKKEGKALKAAIKSAKNRAKTSHRNPFASVTPDGKPPNQQLGKADIPRTSLTAVKHVGNGQFGDVYLANYRVSATSAQGNAWLKRNSSEEYGGEVEVQVAVKTLKPSSKDSDQNEFLEEAELQLGLEHSNIVNILGVAMTAKPYLCALEFALYGDLLEILKASKEKDVVMNEWEQTYLLCQLADALGYLKKNRIAHIDLVSDRTLRIGLRWLRPRGHRLWDNRPRITLVSSRDCTASIMLTCVQTYMYIYILY